MSPRNQYYSVVPHLYFCGIKTRAVGKLHICAEWLISKSVPVWHVHGRQEPAGSSPHGEEGEASGHFLPERARCSDHVHEGRADLLPFACFEATVRVYPQLAVGQSLAGKHD